MEDNLCIEVNSSNSDSKMYMPNIKIEYLDYKKVYINFGHQHIYFNFEENRFDTSLSILKITNNRERFKDKNFVKLQIVSSENGSNELLTFGDYKELLIANNLIIGKKETLSDIIAIIDEDGIFTPDAKSAEDEDHKFGGFIIAPKSYKPKIWKVSA